MSEHPGYRVVTVVGLLLTTFSGCGEELGPEQFPTAVVSGTITVAGRPLRGGWVEFVPVGGTRGDLRSAPIGPDGSYRADGVAVGRVAIGVASPRLDPGVAWPVPPAKLRFDRSPIRFTIPEGASPLRRDFDLAAEFSASQSPPRNDGVRPQ